MNRCGSGVVPGVDPRAGEDVRSRYQPTVYADWTRLGQGSRADALGLRFKSAHFFLIYQPSLLHAHSHRSHTLIAPSSGANRHQMDSALFLRLMNA